MLFALLNMEQNQTKPRSYEAISSALKFIATFISMNSDDAADPIVQQIQETEGESPSHVNAPRKITLYAVLCPKVLRWLHSIANHCVAS